ncbi:RING finger protein [Wickerhamomyces ciferrii]|uniref:RING finger protein n=1 Tax=Wickerhamomyces ciferrii (strain ATCC 14091 / BCRC 22168 / CBS 111 / JCM 3599 / NBRC 0793 / NRRL Y-1031 F-60-10) TaxID=1206466 RepID=K0K762_WICCF|nr:RING finger protein [Wickerhamomyces ciferrii]CCH40695.1 RING finger protein [Wickerhamomyces ciferrii]
MYHWFNVNSKLKNFSLLMVMSILVPGLSTPIPIISQSKDFQINECNSSITHMQQLDVPYHKNGTLLNFNETNSTNNCLYYVPDSTVHNKTTKSRSDTNRFARFSTWLLVILFSILSTVIAIVFWPVLSEQWGIIRQKVPRIIRDGRQRGQRKRWIICRVIFHYRVLGFIFYSLVYIVLSIPGAVVLLIVYMIIGICYLFGCDVTEGNDTNHNGNNNSSPGDNDRGNYQMQNMDNGNNDHMFRASPYNRVYRPLDGILDSVKYSGRCVKRSELDAYEFDGEVLKLAALSFFIPDENFSKRAFHYDLTSEDFKLDHQDSCLICLETLRPYDFLIILPCDHIIHFGCLVRSRTTQLENALPEDTMMRCPTCQLNFVRLVQYYKEHRYDPKKVPFFNRE